MAASPDKERVKRSTRAADGVCINGCGPRTHGVRCCRCAHVHKVGARIATAELRKLGQKCPRCGNSTGRDDAPTEGEAANDHG